MKIFPLNKIKEQLVLGDVMEQYLEKGKEILKILINNGCEAYLIGGAVCNTILQIPFDEIEITTNATPEMVKGIFSQSKVENEGEGLVRLYYLGYQFIISTFRVAEKYKDNRAPVRFHYSKNLHDDLAARDFTINAIAMSHGGKLTDAYRGFEDIQKKKIRVIGSPKIRFTEDPLRMLRAVRLASELGFKIDSKTLRGIKSKSKLLIKLTPEKMSEELKRILNGKYLKKSLKYLIETKLFKRIPILDKEFKRLSNQFRFEGIDIFLACAYVKKGAYSPEWEKMSNDPEILKKMIDLALVTPKSNYDAVLLYSYGLKICQDANVVNQIVRKTPKKIKKIKRDYELLPIHRVCDLKFKGEDVLELTNNRSGDYVQTIVDNMIMKVLKQELNNEYDALKIFAINSLRELGILPSIMNVEEDYEYDEPIKANYNQTALNENKITENNIINQSVDKEVFINDKPNDELSNELKNADSIVNDYTGLKLDQLQRKIYEHERILQEKDAKIKELERRALEFKLESDVNNLVGQNLELLKDMNYIEKGAEKVMISQELRDVYRGIISNVDPKYRSLKEDKK